MRDRDLMAHALAGLQAGMAGALVMLAWLTAAMLWVHHSVWWFPNLMATTFGGDAALQQGFGRYTASGLALHLTQYSLVGVAFAVLTAMPLPGVGKLVDSGLVLAGVIIGVAWYYLMYGLVWKNVNPLISLYSPDRAILVAHVFYGLMLGRLPAYLKSKAGATE